MKLVAFAFSVGVFSLGLGCNGVTLIDSDAAGAGGTTSASGGSGSGGTSVTNGGAPAACVDPTPVPGTSVVRCADGSFDRIADGPAAAPPPSPGSCTSQGTNNAPPDLCSTDADCSKNGAKARCQLVAGTHQFQGQQSCGCVSYCEADADCGSGTACVPLDPSVSGGPSECGYATCRSGADCPSGECAFVFTAYTGPNSGFCAAEPSLVCRTATDACRSNADCTSAPATNCAGTAKSSSLSCFEVLGCP